MTRTTSKLNIDTNRDTDNAGFGALETERGCLPLVAMDVRSSIAGIVARTSVRQTFRNSLDEALEATYIFPLPDRAAVTRFQLRVADRTIEGDLQERGQAREEYDRAIAQGHRAAIAEEERSGVFTLRVGNIPPREQATVELTLVGLLPVADGEATFRFPLVVAPRYTAGVPLDGPSVGDGTTPDTDEVPDASRVTPPVMLPGFPNPVRLSLEVELDPPAGASAGDWAAEVKSSLHSTLSDGDSTLNVRLQPGERLGRDFILRFPIAGKAIASSLAVAPASESMPGVFGLTLFPPKFAAAQTPAPREVVFVLDRSGSMGGWKMVAARRALGRMIDTLLDQDRFTVVAFDQWIEYALDARDGQLISGANRDRWRVLEWLGKIEARGGTEMLPALTEAMHCFSRNTDQANSNIERILVIVTDGQVTGEDAILKALDKSSQGIPPRVFTVGIDQAVNASFLRRLADFGQGACELVESEQRLDEAMDRVHRLIGTPLLTDVRLEPVNFDWVADSLAPERIADLFVDRPVAVLGRHLSSVKDLQLRVHATDAAGNPWSETITARPAKTDMLLSMWGRAKVRDLEDQYAAQHRGRNKKLMQQIVDVSLESHVLSRFTAYVAVDGSEVVNEGGQRAQVVQPVEMPAGWDDIGAAMLASGGVMRCMSYGGSAKMRRMAPKLAVACDSMLEEFDESCDAAASVIQGITSDSDIVDISNIEALADSAPVHKLVNMLLLLAIRDGASELRLQRKQREVHVVQIVGGRVVELVPPPVTLWEELLSRLETMAGLNPAQRDASRAGECEVTVGGHQVRLYIASTPSPDGPAISIKLQIDQPQENAESKSKRKSARRKAFWK